MSEALDVIATIEVQAGRGAEVIAVVTDYLDVVRAEEGCIRYDLFGVKRDPDTLVMVERWASKEALRAHGTASHFVEMSGRLADLVTGAPKVRVLEPVAQVAT